MQRNYLEQFKKLPLTLISLITVICIIGFIVLYSASNSNLQPWAYKQIINFCIFLPLSIIIATLDLRLIFRFSYIFYFLVLALLLSVELFGSVSMGAKRWIDLGIIRLQPSEPIKLAIVLMLARYFHRLKFEDLTKIHKILVPIIAVIIPVLLIIKEPDLGTGIINIIITGIIFFAVGFRIRNFVIIGLIVFACIPVIWNIMHDYQKKRVMVFLDPEREPLGAGYNIIQSKIAIGSGGGFGQGLNQGSQSHLDFLPEHQTDFIFATYAEEFGFIGGIFLLLLYSLVIIISLIIAINSRSIFGKLMVIGITSILFSHVFINMAMVMGLLPVVGVPLPFISYGGTMMASMLIGFGLVMNVQVNQHTNLN
ncbi:MULTISPECIES: rod shape-determining protein RodA [unclassified Rickettsia]|uniref:rod shape-determining protein RodA n=1 Tax=unclassified Rickettsia TaxID=114295 RepID=UPI00209D35CE|nr:rod shape-determining protein RodA [Rickettsia endosymbiont of Ceutorhynchus assimilis]